MKIFKLNDEPFTNLLKSKYLKEIEVYKSMFFTDSKSKRLLVQIPEFELPLNRRRSNAQFISKKPFTNESVKLNLPISISFEWGQFIINCRKEIVILNPWDPDLIDYILSKVKYYKKLFCQTSTINECYEAGLIEESDYLLIEDKDQNIAKQSILTKEKITMPKDEHKISRKLESFICYSKFDGEECPKRDSINYLEEFKETLSPLIRHTNVLGTWDDTLLLAGENWDDRIKEELKRVDIIFLLISSSFLDTKYIEDQELKIAIERHEKNECVIIPVIIKECGWADISFISKLSALPRKGHSISSWKKDGKYASKDEAWNDVYQGVKAIVQSKAKIIDLNLIVESKETYTINSLNKYEKILIKTACSVENCNIIKVRSGDGLHVQVNDLSLIDNQDSRTVAAWEEAFDNLINLGIIKQRGLSSHFLTTKGYEIGDNL